MTELPFIAPGYEPGAERQAEELRGVLANRTQPDRSTLIAAVAVALRTPFLRVLRLTELILIPLSAGLLVWSIVEKHGTAAVVRNAFLLAMVLYFYIYQFRIYPKKVVKDLLYRNARDESDQGEADVLYFTRQAVARRRGGEAQIRHMPYEKIRWAAESRELIVLRTKSRSLLPLRKTGFENGTAQDLWPLLQELAPKARLYRRRQQDET